MDRHAEAERHCRLLACLRTESMSTPTYVEQLGCEPPAFAGGVPGSGGPDGDGCGVVDVCRHPVYKIGERDRCVTSVLNQESGVTS